MVVPNLISEGMWSCWSKESVCLQHLLQANWQIGNIIILQKSIHAKIYSQLWRYRLQSTGVRFEEKKVSPYCLKSKLCGGTLPTQKWSKQQPTQLTTPLKWTHPACNANLLYYNTTSRSEGVLVSVLGETLLHEHIVCRMTTACPERHKGKTLFCKKKGTKRLSWGRTW